MDSSKQSSFKQKTEQICKFFSKKKPSLIKNLKKFSNKLSNFEQKAMQI